MDVKPMGEIAVLLFNRAGFLSCSCWREINVLAFEKNGELYAFLYDDESRAENFMVLGRFASNQELSFTWYDAAVLSQKIRQEKEKQKSQPKRRF